MDQEKEFLYRRRLNVGMCLQAISIGDALGEEPHKDRSKIGARYRWTDDTAMARSIAYELLENGEINPESLAHRFGKEFIEDPMRGYGTMARQILTQLAERSHEWERISRSVGSFGNGSAMRVAPIGAYFDDPNEVAIQAELSAKITHYSNDGIAGAIAVAVATSLMTWTDEPQSWFFTEIFNRLPDCDTKDIIRKVESVALYEKETRSVQDTFARFGSGRNALMLETVPSLLLIAYDFLVSGSSDFGGLLVEVSKCGGDSDTNCAILAGILGVRYFKEIPMSLYLATERLNFEHGEIRIP